MWSWLSPREVAFGRSVANESGSTLADSVEPPFPAFSGELAV
jgi:hypothetical protein